jgi:hypothetical protein
MEGREAPMKEAEERAMPTRRAVLQAAIGTASAPTALSVLYVGVGLILKAIND